MSRLLLGVDERVLFPVGLMNLAWMVALAILLADKNWKHGVP